MDTIHLPQFVVDRKRQQIRQAARSEQRAMAWGALFIGLIFGLILGGM